VAAAKMAKLATPVQLYRPPCSRSAVVLVETSADDNLRCFHSADTGKLHDDDVLVAVGDATRARCGFMTSMCARARRTPREFPRCCVDAFPANHRRSTSEVTRPLTDLCASAGIPSTRMNAAVQFEGVASPAGQRGVFGRVGSPCSSPIPQRRRAIARYNLFRKLRSVEHSDSNPHLANPPLAPRLRAPNTSRSRYRSRRHERCKQSRHDPAERQQQPQHGGG